MAGASVASVVGVGRGRRRAEVSERHRIVNCCSSGTGGSGVVAGSAVASVVGVG